MKALKFIDWAGIVMILIIIVLGVWDGYGWILNSALVLSLITAFFIRAKWLKIVLCIIGILLLLGSLFMKEIII